MYDYIVHTHLYFLKSIGSLAENHMLLFQKFFLITKMLINIIKLVGSLDLDAEPDWKVLNQLQRMSELLNLVVGIKY